MNAAAHSQPAARWSLWLLLTGLLVFGGFVALPMLQAALPERAVAPAAHVLADEWQQQRWLLSSRALLRPQHAATQVDEHWSPSDPPWLVAVGLLPELLSAVCFVRVTAFSPAVLPRRTLAGAPRGPPAALLQSTSNSSSNCS